MLGLPSKTATYKGITSLPALHQASYLTQAFSLCQTFFTDLAIPFSSFSLTVLNFGSVSASSFCFSSIFSSNFCLSFKSRFYKKEKSENASIKISAFYFNPHLYYSNLKTVQGSNITNTVHIVWQTEQNQPRKCANQNHKWVCRFWCNMRVL